MQSVGKVLRRRWSWMAAARGRWLTGGVGAERAARGWRRRGAKDARERHTGAGSQFREEGEEACN